MSHHSDTSLLHHVSKQHDYMKDVDGVKVSDQMFAHGNLQTVLHKCFKACTLCLIKGVCILSRTMGGSGIGMNHSLSDITEVGKLAMTT